MKWRTPPPIEEGFFDEEVGIFWRAPGLLWERVLCVIAFLPTLVFFVLNGIVFAVSNALFTPDDEFSLDLYSEIFLVELRCCMIWPEWAFLLVEICIFFWVGITIWATGMFSMPFSAVLFFFSLETCLGSSSKLKLQEALGLSKLRSTFGSWWWFLVKSMTLAL